MKNVFLWKVAKIPKYLSLPAFFTREYLEYVCTIQTNLEANWDNYPFSDDKILTLIS